ncbi:Holliday junction branch migration protein RuvA [Candidatus Coxiella mudrowiae]|uniref:Holliday junction branch migration protein RuvA n=1 Tax=Candidatus Coxiella mudrowiae TaxID=2054173 RepID=UPI000C284E90|nr:Holliday junction branch migration protein RuvA [Candidatus Coxiella mudrowiae]
MIGQLRGIILEKQPPYLLLEVSGVGYEIAAPLSIFQCLPDIGEEIVLYTHLVVREDAHTLYGFHNERDRRLFRALIKVNGVGPKLALTILSGIGLDEFVSCIIKQDIHQLIRIPGIGRKTAERLIIETKDALTSWQLNIISHNETNTPLASSTQDAISALIALGYKPKEAKRAINAVQEPELTSEDLIRQALKKIVARV